MIKRLYLKLLNEYIHKPNLKHTIGLVTTGLALGIYSGYRGYHYIMKHLVKSSYIWKDTKPLNLESLDMIQSKYKFRISNDLKEILLLGNGGFPTYKDRKLTNYNNLPFNHLLSFNLEDIVNGTTIEELFDYYISKFRRLPFAVSSDSPTTYFTIDTNGYVYYSLKMYLTSNLYSFLWGLT